jgi:NADPH:quinone reductase-like Zn-dependent oxidoreductase
MHLTGKQLTSTLAADGTLTIELVEQTLPPPSAAQVVVKVEAAPINPSDLGVLFGPADMENAIYRPGRVQAQMPASATRALAARHGVALPAGNECAGTVVGAGDDPESRALLGKRVACVPGGAYAELALVDARGCMPLPADVTAEQGASAYVNPMTVLGFVETMRMEGHSAIVHTAAASNLGQMLMRVCQEDGIPLVNIVRSDAQVKILLDLGARHVVDSSAAELMPRLIEAIGETQAMLGFDAIGGGPMAGQILTAMEAVASKGAVYSRYGSATPKRVYIYGMLDLGPTILHRSFGLKWDVGGWLVSTFLGGVGPERVERMRRRVLASLTSTFASHYKARVTLEGMLEKDAIRVYNARRTGEKYLVLPHG